MPREPFVVERYRMRPLLVGRLAVRPIWMWLHLKQKYALTSWPIRAASVSACSVACVSPWKMCFPCPSTLQQFSGQRFATLMFWYIPPPLLRVSIYWDYHSKIKTAASQLSKINPGGAAHSRQGCFWWRTGCSPRWPRCRLRWGAAGRWGRRLRAVPRESCRG